MATIMQRPDENTAALLANPKRARALDWVLSSVHANAASHAVAPTRA